MSAVIENMYQQFRHYVFGAFGLRFGKGVDQRNANGLSYQSNESLSEYSVSTSDDAFEGNREKVLATLRGSQITIPDPQSLLNGWPAAVNPKIDRLEGDMQERLKQIFSKPKETQRLKKMRGTRVAHFGSSWWPYASYDGLFIGTCLSLWLFAWDDETDSLEYSDISGDFERSCAFRRETMAYIEHSLTSDDSEKLSQISSNPMITNFKEVGQAIRTSCPKRQVTTFLNALRFFVEMCEEEQALQMTQELPTIEQYLRRRMGSSGVEVCLAIQEYCFGVDIPGEVMQSEAMKVIWHETNVIISTMNDMMSIKKEMDNSQIDSLIPLLFIQLGSVQGAMDKAAEMTKSAVHRFALAEKDIKTRYASEPELLNNLTNFIDGCKYACTGNMNWSLTSGRYKLPPYTSGSPIQVTL